MNDDNNSYGHCSPVLKDNNYPPNYIKDKLLKNIALKLNTDLSKNVQNKVVHLKINYNKRSYLEMVGAIKKKLEINHLNYIYSYLLLINSQKFKWFICTNFKYYI